MVKEFPKVVAVDFNDLEAVLEYSVDILQLLHPHPNGTAILKFVVQGGQSLEISLTSDQLKDEKISRFVGVPLGVKAFDFARLLCQALLFAFASSNFKAYRLESKAVFPDKGLIVLRVFCF